MGQDIVESTNYTSYYLTFFNTLPVIGIVHPNAYKKIGQNTIKGDYLSIPSQFIAFLVGLIDGDGYIQIGQTGKGFIAMKLVISLHLNDLSTLQYIHSVLKLGKITIYRDIRNPTCKLIINKTDLQSTLFPLLLHHKIFFITNTRIDQFNLAMYILKNDIKLFDSMPYKDNIPSIFNIPRYALEYKKLGFFKN